MTLSPGPQPRIKACPVTDVGSGVTRILCGIAYKGEHSVMSHQSGAFRIDRGTWFTHLVILACLVVLTAVQAAAQEPGAAVEESLEQHVAEGNVIVTLAADRRSMGMADQLRLTLSVTAPADTGVIFPEIFDRLGPFLVRNDFTADPEILDAQLRQWKREYLLEVEEVGELAIPPLTITLLEEGAAEDAAPQQLTTAPFQIVVTSILPEGADLKKPKDIAPPVELAWRGLPVWAWIAIAAALVLAVLAILWWRRERRRRLLRGEPGQPAHGLALAALDRLQNDDLISQQRIEEFYVRVSGILRYYIEWRFGLRAPEQTTEEFLDAMLVAGGPIAAHRDLLSAFLEHCDLVKFARHQPATDDMHNALQRARDFVEQTADPEALVSAEAAGAYAA